MNAFPLKDMIAASYGNVFGNYRLLIRAAGIWIALAVIVGGLMIASAGHETLTDLSPANIPASFALLSLVDSILALLGLTATVVFWHRYTLLGETNLGLAAPVGRDVFRYIWASFAIGIMAAFPAMLLLMIAGANPATLPTFMIIILIIAAWLTARFILVLPAVATGRSDLSFKQSWQRTSGRSMTIFAGLLATILPFYIAGIVLGEIISAIDAGFTLLAVLLRNVLTFTQAAVFAGFMSLTLRYFETSGDQQRA